MGREGRIKGGSSDSLVLGRRGVQGAGKPEPYNIKLMPTAAATQKSVSVDERRRRVARLYMAGKLQTEMAEEFGVTQPTISNDLRILREEWMRESGRLVAERYAEELAKIDNVERICWEAYERSVKEKVEIKLMTNEGRERRKSSEDKAAKAQGLGKGGKADAPPPNAQLVVVGRMTEKKVTNQVGDPRFLDRIAWCIETRLKLMGFLKNETKNTLNVLTINWDDMNQRPTLTGADRIEQAIAAVAMKNAPNQDKESIELSKVENNPPLASNDTAQSPTSNGEEHGTKAGPEEDSGNSEAGPGPSHDD